MRNTKRNKVMLLDATFVSINSVSRSVECQGHILVNAKVRTSTAEKNNVFTKNIGWNNKRLKNNTVDEIFA